MKIAIMSDAHDQWENLSQAVNMANEQDCEYLLFAGDLICPNGLNLLSNFNGEVKMVLGNNEGEIAGLMLNAQAISNVEFPKQDGHQINRGAIAEETLGGLTFFMNHYPRLAEIAAHSGLFDVCIFGHNHTYSEQKVNNCWLLNPGALTPANEVIPSFMIFNTEDKSIKKIIL